MVSKNKSSIIDELKKEYKYELDPLNLANSPLINCYSLHRHFYNELKKFTFEEKIKEIKKIINDKGDKIEKNLLNSIEKTLKEISDDNENIIKKEESDLNENISLLADISNDYESSMDKPGVTDTYIKIIKYILDKEVNNLIKLQKSLILNNELIIDIKKKFN